MASQLGGDFSDVGRTILSVIFSRTYFYVLFTLLLFTTVACGEPPADRPHQDLNYYTSADGKHVPIRTMDDWQKRREQILEGMQKVMGPLPHPTEPVPLDVHVLEEHQDDGYIRRKIAYHTDSAKERVRAWLLIPAGGADNLRAGVLCLHQTTPNGKNSPVGLTDRPSVHYAQELTRRGFVTLSPDYPSFGEYTYDFKADNYRSGTMKAIYDNTRAIDVLQALPEIDRERIGCIGHSLGGHNALFTAVFEPRIKAVVTSCGFTSFHKYKGGDLKGWTSSRYMPLIRSELGDSPDRMPFDFPEVLGAIAPRAVFVVAPLHDDNFDVSGVRDCLAAARPVFELYKATDKLQGVFPDAPHEFTDAERVQAYEFLKTELVGTDRD